MNPQIERLQALVAQLIARLEHERSESRRLASQLASREAELAQTKRRLEDMRRKGEALFSASHGDSRL
jgi:chromosome segregation ATPase